MSISGPENLEEALENVRRHPESVDARESLLEATANLESALHPVRLETILWFVEWYPEHDYADTPFMSIDPKTAPAAFGEVLSAWLRQVEVSPTSIAVLKGAASFVALRDRGHAIDLLNRALEISESANLHIAVGNTTEDYTIALAHFEKAAALEPEHPNIWVFCAVAALRSGEYGGANRYAQKLLEDATAAEQRLGDAVSWTESGNALFQRAFATTNDPRDAGQLALLLASRAYWLHSAHTVLGVLASVNDEVEEAVEHLLLSGQVQRDFRLNAYGPKPDLVLELCRQNRWKEVEQFLQRWRQQFDEHDEVSRWLDAVRRREMPVARGLA